MSGIEKYMLPCLNKKLFGFDCMGCGLQRAFSLLLHGQFLDAFYMYPAIYTLIPFFILVIGNTIKPFTYAQKLIMILACVNVAVIMVSFILKTFIIK